MNTENKFETATLANGCFWCTEAVFQRLKGVIKVESGYSGGHLENPTYRQVCTGQTGHAECLQITFDTAIISFEDLLKVFWETHDPTTLNRQGNDVGTQYRSTIFYHNEAQKEWAIHSKKMLEESNLFKKPVVTTIVPFEKFYPAEKEHYDYYNRNPEQAYCRFVVRPKVEKLQNKFPEKLK